MMIALQDVLPLPTADMNPWVWFTGVAVIVIGVLAKSIRDNYNERIKRCEGREDRLIEDNRVCLASTKDLLTATLRATDLAESANALHQQTDQKLEANSRTFEEVRRLLADIHRSTEELRRSR
jgi:hypothetical protein